MPKQQEVSSYGNEQDEEKPEGKGFSQFRGKDPHTDPSLLVLSSKVYK